MKVKNIINHKDETTSIRVKNEDLLDFLSDLQHLFGVGVYEDYAIQRNRLLKEVIDLREATGTQYTLRERTAG